MPPTHQVKHLEKRNFFCDKIEVRIVICFQKICVIFSVILVKETRNCDPLRIVYIFNEIELLATCNLAILSFKSRSSFIFDCEVIVDRHQNSSFPFTSTT